MPSLPPTVNIYEARTYRDVVKGALAAEGEAHRRGAVRRLATFLRCHSTYVSQVTKGKADFSVDQATRFCLYARLPDDQAEFFLDLLQRDRAATKEARSHFQGRLDRRVAEQQDMKKRWRVAEALTAEQESKYYAAWIPQAVHLHCQLPGVHTPESLAGSLGITAEQTRRTLADLAVLGLVESTAKGWQSRRDSVHLGKDSPNFVRSHVNWRLKTIADATTGGAMPGTHYSSVISMSEKTAREIDRLILDHLEKTRDAILPSPPERLYVYCLDFYPLRRDRPEP
jgi:uncharacterized protein (TIGR02147 family)